MHFPYLSGGMLTAMLAFGAPLIAQTVSLPGIPTTFVVQQSFTTGVVGFSSNQTARLNVLNLNPVPTLTTTTVTSTAQPANCTLELQFYDDKSTLIKQSVVPNFAPGAIASFDLTRATVTSETTARAEIRGVVVVNPASSPVASPAAVGYCSVMTTLEVFDNTTGNTITFTSDTRPIGTGFALTPAISTAPFR